MEEFVLVISNGVVVNRGQSEGLVLMESRDRYSPGGHLPSVTNYIWLYSLHVDGSRSTEDYT